MVKFKNLIFSLLFILFIISLILMLEFVSAEVVLVAPENQTSILINSSQSNQSNSSYTANNTNLDFNLNKDDLLAYIGNMTERLVLLDKKYIQAVDILEGEKEFYKGLYLNESTQVNNLQNSFTEYKERKEVQISGYEKELERQYWMRYIYVIIASLLTLLIVEFVLVITKGKSLYFWLRKMRAYIPIDVGMILGRKEEK